MFWLIFVWLTVDLRIISQKQAYNRIVKYTPGPMIGELSGKAGCVVGAHNRFGPYLRVRTIPVNANTTIQQNARNNLSSISQYWKTITSTQKAAWSAAAASIVLYDRLGRAYTPTGFQYFCSCNRNVYVYDSAAAKVADPPAVAAPAALLSLTITATSV